MGLNMGLLQLHTVTRLSCVAIFICVMKAAAETPAATKVCGCALHAAHVAFGFDNPTANGKAASCLTPERRERCKPCVISKEPQMFSV